MVKSKKKKTFKRVSKERVKSMSFFERRKYKRNLRKELEARRRAEMLASLPKQPIKRFFAKLNPKYFLKNWFSLYGLRRFFKFCAACLLIGIILLGGLFVYFKKEIKDISVSNIEISDTVNRYLDRNGELLWEDTGSNDYRLTVEGDDISDYMRKATIAIEDKNFYDHIGVDFSALIRATISTLSHKGVQGGSTLTQQLIKQVYFADEAASANRGGVTRKIKELILSIELEKMYTKDEILTMYLNESPYGGRRNGVESASQTYFGKSAKDLNIAESALLAAIPNNPAVLNPYNTYGHEMLIERQHRVLDDMLSQGYITQEEADEAKQYNILATIKSESSQYANIYAPHFVLEVKSQLEAKYGLAVMRAGGLTIKTTLDKQAQEIAEQAVTDSFNKYHNITRGDNAAMVSIDVESSQVIAMVGSVDFSNESFGSYNVTTSLIEPGSTIKPVLDYAPLFQQREGQNFGPGTILRDENIDYIYCAGNKGSCSLRNFTRAFYGNVSIRNSLGNSLNIPAVKALYINGIDNSLETLHALGDKSYCKDLSAGLSIAIGSGCNIRLTEHANTYASIARGGSYKDLVYVLEIKNSSGDILESWEDKKGQQVVDEQVAYMIADILGDANARNMVFGSTGRSAGYVVSGVWTGVKTGTTTTTNSNVTKDILMVSFSTAVSTVVWNGNHDGTGLKSSSKDVVRNIVNDYMSRVHKEVYANANDGRHWESGDTPKKPSGIQTLTVNGVTDIWPSWYNNKTSGIEKETFEFNKFTKKLASTCTIDEYKISIEATKTVDPFTKKTNYFVPDGYDMDTVDDCQYVYVKPIVSAKKGEKNITITVTKGSEQLNTYSITIDGSVVESGNINSTTFESTYVLKGTEKNITITVTDSLGESASVNI